MTQTTMNSEEYLMEMYASVERMNTLTLEGDKEKIDEEKDKQLLIKRKFFDIKPRIYSNE